MTPSSGQMTPGQLNAIARATIKARAVKMTQQIFNATYGAAANTSNVALTQPVVNVIPRNVGLIRGFWVKVVATFNNQSAGTATLTDFGPSNILSQIQFNDLNNNTRIQTTGWHVGFINSVRARRPFATSFVHATGFDQPVNYGSNWPVFSGALTIPTVTQGTLTYWYYVPLAYSDDDLRGSVYANVVNATMQLNLTLNQNATVTTATDSTSAVYTAATPGTVWFSQLAVTVYQDYLDQLPVGQGGVLLPVLDLATIYELKNTTFTAVVPGNDFPAQYANFRDFLSTVAVYVNTGATGARGVGADINYWALQSANFTNIWKKEPNLIALQTRNHLQTDLPPGTYYFSSREKPISTVQYGNMQLVLNPITAGAGAYLLLGYEDFALVQTLSMAGSLAAS
jgi:P3 major capsid protein